MSYMAGRPAKCFPPLAKQCCQHNLFYILMEKHIRSIKWHREKWLQNYILGFCINLCKPPSVSMAGSMVINVSFMVGCLLVDYVKLSCNAWELHCSDIYQSAKHQLSHWHFISRTTPSKHRAKDSCPAKFGIFRDFTFFGSTKQTNLSSSKGDNSICDVYISLSVDTLKLMYFSSIWERNTHICCI